MPDFITIDGAIGGGQMLRNAVALSAVSGRPVRVVNIRRSRPQPGLRPQHLLAVKAVAEACGGELIGAEIGSQEVSLIPRTIAPPSEWRLDIGTAGSITLLLQCLLPALAHAPTPTTLTLIGGTDVPFSPPYDYFAHVFVPAMRHLGIEMEVQLVRRGFYPKGGGEMVMHITPTDTVPPIFWTEKSAVIRTLGGAYSMGLPEHIVERMQKSAHAFLAANNFHKIDITQEIVASGPSTGCGIAVWVETRAGLRLGGSALGERGKPAEKVGEEAAKMLLHETKGGGAIDSHLADQLLVWLALANGPSEFTTSRITEHMTSAAHVAETIVGAHFELDPGPPVRVRCQPACEQE